MDMKNWDEYRYFLAVARSGSLRSAAEALGVTQPTVGRRISNLERMLGSRLFDRSSDGLALNASGRAIVDLAVEMEHRVRAIATRVTSQDDVLGGPVTITAPEGLGIHWLAKRLPLFSEQYPDVRVTLNIETAKVDLFRGAVDIALRIGDPECLELVGRVVGTARFGLYGSERYLIERGRPTKPEQLHQHNIIDLYGTLEHLPQVVRLRELTQHATVRVRCDSLCAQFVAASSGAGLAALPSYVVADGPELSRVLADVFDIELDVWLLTHPELKNKPRIRLVIDWLMAEIASDDNVHLVHRNRSANEDDDDPCLDHTAL